MKEITVTLKEKVDFSKAQVGDDVFCLLRGPGKIEKIVVCAIHPIRVTFINNRHNTYLFSGHDINEHNEYAALYFFNPDMQEVLYERPEPEIDWNTYKGQVIEVSDDGSTWHKRKLFEYKSELKRKFLCWANVGTIGIYLWKQARLIKEDS